MFLRHEACVQWQDNNDQEIIRMTVWSVRNNRAGQISKISLGENHFQAENSAEIGNDIAF